MFRLPPAPVLLPKAPVLIVAAGLLKFARFNMENISKRSENFKRS